MRSTMLWARLLGLVKAVVEGVWFDEDDECVVVSVRPRKATKRRCGKCVKRSAGYDQGGGRRRWRALDLGTIPAFLEADSPRVRCVEHGVIAAQVPWARHGAGHTYAFDDTAAWLATHTSKSAVRDLLRIAWRTVGAIVTRVVADAEATTDRFAKLRRIGIDEISYKRGHRYLTVVVDHDSGCCCGRTTAATPRRWGSSSIGSAPSGAPPHAIIRAVVLTRDCNRAGASACRVTIPLSIARVPAACHSSRTAAPVAQDRACDQASSALSLIHI